jgi:hypothetical protein
MFLGDDRLNSLACYIHGFIYGLEHAGVSDTADERFLKAFGRWLGERLDKQTGDCWFYIERCLPGGEGHIDDFFRELDRYLHELGYSGLSDEKLDLLAWKDR